MPAIRKFEILKAGHDWWLFVPAAYLLSYGMRETGRYRRRTFAEIVKLRDFYVGRLRAARSVSLWYHPDYRIPYWEGDE